MGMLMDGPRQSANWLEEEYEPLTLAIDKSNSILKQKNELCQ
jgi:hypothetical protein